MKVLLSGKNIENNCPICLRGITIKNKLECGHLVHLKCISKCYKCECPICRKPLVDIPHSIKEKIQFRASLEEENEYMDKMVALILYYHRFLNLDSGVFFYFDNDINIYF
jgi:hypothetical protein